MIPIFFYIKRLLLRHFRVLTYTVTTVVSRTRQYRPTLINTLENTRVAIRTRVRTQRTFPVHGRWAETIFSTAFVRVKTKIDRVLRQQIHVRIIQL